MVPGEALLLLSDSHDRDREGMVIAVADINGQASVDAHIPLGTVPGIRLFRVRSVAAGVFCPEKGK